MTPNTQRPVSEIANELFWKREDGPDADEIEAALLSERQEAEKLRQENEMLRHRINDDSATTNPHNAGSCLICHAEYKRGFDEGYAQGDVSEDGLTINEIEKENEALRAQVAELVGALNYIQDKVLGEGGIPKPISYDVSTLLSKRIDNALSTLPSQYLEIAKAKDAVIEAGWQMMTYCDPSNPCFDDCRESVSNIFWEKCLALRTLQQAQEKV